MGLRVNKILREKFGAKVFVYFSLLFIFASFLFISLFYHHQSREMRDKLIKTGEMLTEIFNQNAGVGVFAETPSLFEKPMRSIKNLSGVINISVYNTQGNLLQYLSNTDGPNAKSASLPRDVLSDAFLETISKDTFYFEEKASCFTFWKPITMAQSYALIASGAGRIPSTSGDMGAVFPPENSEVNMRFDTKLPDSNADNTQSALGAEGGEGAPSDFVGVQPPLEQNIIGYTTISISNNELKKQIRQLLQYIAMVGFIVITTGSVIIFLIIHNITTPLNRLTQSVKTLESRKAGTLIEKVPVETNDEIGKLATAINHMSRTIQRREEALTKSEKRLRILSSRLIDIRDSERKKLSQDLHDDLNQTLANLKMKVRRIGRQSPTDLSAIKEESDETALEVDRIIDSVRRISKDLSPSLLEDLGLSSGLKWLLNNFEKQHDITVTSVVNDIDSLFSKEARINIFRLFQEALSNIRKHAAAEHVSVVIKKGDGGVTFIISDDGTGFDAAGTMTRDAEDMGIGLINMNERARILGADLEIKSNEGDGTFITLKVATSNCKESKQWTLTA